MNQGRKKLASIADYKRRESGDWFEIVKAETGAADLIREVSREMNRPTVHCWTWAIGTEQAMQLEKAKADGEIKRFTVICDYSIKKRTPEAWRIVERSASRYSVMDTHVKMYLLTTPGHSRVILSSANLNKTPRAEFYLVTQEKGIIDKCRAAIARGLKNGRR